MITYLVDTSALWHLFRTPGALRPWEGHIAAGVFHLATWAFTFAGMVTALVAWRQDRIAPSWAFHFGLVLAGWGLFNLVEGVIDHQILGVHHVRDDLGGPLAWDLGFLAVGLLQVAGGWLLHRRGARRLHGRSP